MTIAKDEYMQMLQDILKLDIGTCTAEICIAARKDSASLPEFRRIRLTESIKEQFRDIVAACLLECQKQIQLHNLSVLEFDVAGKADSYQIEHIELAKKPYDHIVEQTRPLLTYQGLDAFTGEPSFNESMRFYVIILRPPQGEAIYFYRRYSPKKGHHAEFCVKEKLFRRVYFRRYYRH